MSLTERVKAVYLDRLTELIQRGESLPMQQHSRVVGSNAYSGEKTYRHYTLASLPEFVEWRTSCAAVLDQVVPPTSILRKTVDHFPQLGDEPEKVQSGVAFLRSIKAELEKGSLDAIALQLENEILSDYLGQAEGILKEPGEGLSHVAAAVIAGASLERALRSMCLTLVPPEPVVNDKDSHLGMTALIDALKRRQAFNEIQAKQLRAWAGIRNSAAHGNFEEFTRHQVEQMVEGIVAFIARFGA